MRVLTPGPQRHLARSQVPTGQGSCRRDSCIGKITQLPSNSLVQCSCDDTPFPCIISDGGTSSETSAEEDSQ